MARRRAMTKPCNNGVEGPLARRDHVGVALIQREGDAAGCAASCRTASYRRAAAVDRENAVYEVKPCSPSDQPWSGRWCRHRDPPVIEGSVASIHVDTIAQGRRIALGEQSVDSEYRRTAGSPL